MAINYIKPYADRNLYLIAHNIVSVQILENKDDEHPEAKYYVEIMTLNNIIYEVYLNDDAELKAFKVRISHAQSI